MKKLSGLLVVVAVLFVAATTYAASTIDGNYTFKQRETLSKTDNKLAVDKGMDGWTGTMKIENNTMVRNYKSADGTQTKFYESKLENKGGTLITSTMTKAYKQEHVGRKDDSNFTPKGDTLTIANVDGSFKEVWIKK